MLMKTAEYELLKYSEVRNKEINSYADVVWLSIFFLYKISILIEVFCRSDTYYLHTDL